MAAPETPQPDNAPPLRQAFRALVPRPVRAVLHRALIAPTRLPAVAARQLRRAGWGLAAMMRQPRRFLSHSRGAPGRFIYALREQARRLSAAPPTTPDQPSFSHALSRLQQHDLAIRSIINIGAGSGRDSGFVQRIWPEARTLLIEMDASFEAGFRELKTQLPDLAWEICAAGPHDQIGRMRKSEAGGVGGAIDLEHMSADSAPVQFKRIDTLVREHQLPAPYFLRFDTHGYELDVLSGARETLRETALIMMEVYNFKLGFAGNRNLTFDEMSLHMKSMGFRCVDICDPLYRPGDRALWQMHLFFIRADHPLWANSGYSAPGR